MKLKITDKENNIWFLLPSIIIVIIIVIFLASSCVHSIGNDHVNECVRVCKYRGGFKTLCESFWKGPGCECKDGYSVYIYDRNLRD